MALDNDKLKTLREKLSIWFSTPLGEHVLAAELEQLEEILPNLFGYHILQYGYHSDSDYLSASRIVNKTVLFLDETEINRTMNAVHTSAENLPIAADSVDVIVLPHILEYSRDPHKLLREMERALIDDGHVVIIGINPLSLWGLWHLFLCWWGEMPWSGRLISMPRIKDWLLLLDFEVEKSRCFFFSPPFRNQKMLQKFRPLERLGRYIWPIFGGLYVIVAKKRVIPLNPIKMQWSDKRHIIANGVAEPTTRNSINN